MAGFRHYLFGEFRLDGRQRALFRQQELIALAPKSLETLLFLVERHGQIVDNKEILEAVWPETFDKWRALGKLGDDFRTLLFCNPGETIIRT